MVASWVRSHALTFCAPCDAASHRFRLTFHCPASPDAGHALEATTRHAELVYLACHKRPIHEVIAPALRDVSGEFDATFPEMTTEPVELQALLSARERMSAE